ncbi:MAG: TlpA family protein disulfide reductase [Bacteroidales bacterium]|nr:TlpA family protein disulfide reductase [Bacteroidales bacterium]
MKKIIPFLFLLLTTAFVTAQNTLISGQFVSAKSGKCRLIVSHAEGNKLVADDTINLDKAGRFRFVSKITSPTLYLLKFDQYENCFTHVMLEPGNKIGLECRYDTVINTMDITTARGSGNVELYKQFNDILVDFARKNHTMSEEFNSLSTSEARKQELVTQANSMLSERNEKIANLLKNNGDKLMSAFLVTYFDESPVDYIEIYETIQSKLKDKYAGNEFLQHVETVVKKNLGPGRMAPEIAMKDPEGNIRKLSDLRGNIVMIDFWASWCRPCRMENPNVVKLYHKYHDKGFEIYSVSLDKSGVEWRRAIEQDGLVWPNHVSDLNGWTSSGGATYGIMSVPSTVLIDRDGKIIARNLRGPDLANKLKEIFGE